VIDGAAGLRRGGCADYSPSGMDVHRRTSVAAGLALALALAGCGKGSRPRPSWEGTPAQLQLGKLADYRTCLEAHSERVFAIARLYRARYATTPPAPGAQVVINAPAAIDECIEGLERALAVTPPMPGVDAAARGFGTALTRVARVTHAVHVAPATGPAQHGELLAAFDAFDLAQRALFDEALRANHELGQAQLIERAAKDGRKLPLLVDVVAYKAEGVVRFASLSAAQVGDLDVAAFTAALLELEVAIDEMVTAASVDEDASKGVPGYHQIAHHARAYVIACRELAARARGRVPYTAEEQLTLEAGNEAGVIGTPGAMASAYNQLLGVTAR